VNYLEGLSEYQRAFLSSYGLAQLFAVISWGSAATAWLSRVLNSHPDIFCVHASNTFWHVLGGYEKLDGVSYLRIVGSQGHAHIAAGDVHGVSRYQVPDLRRCFGNLFNAVVVVREPLARLRSQLALFEEYKSQNDAWDLTYVDNLVERHSLALPADDFTHRAFIHGANMLNAILEEREVGRIYRAEDLTANAWILGDFIVEITRAKITPTSEWLKAATQTQPVNAHAGHLEVTQFTDWQLDTIRKVVYPSSWQMYAELGYSLSQL
jgi:hypothetical protein